MRQADKTKDEYELSGCCLFRAQPPRTFSIAFSHGIEKKNDKQKANGLNPNVHSASYFLQAYFSSLDP